MDVDPHAATPGVYNDPASAELKWVWEIHKNCDQLLHQRLAAFTAVQAMTLAAFTLLTVARFNASETMMARFGLLEDARVLVVAFGLVMAVFGWAVTYPMFARLLYLNARYLDHNDIYRGYIESIDRGLKIPGTDASFPLGFYRGIIPKWLPVSEMIVWTVLLVLTLAGIAQTPASANHRWTGRKQSRFTHRGAPGRPADGRAEELMAKLRDRHRTGMRS